MVVWALMILAAWILLSFPVAVVVGRMFAARPDAVAAPAFGSEGEADPMRLRPRRREPAGVGVSGGARHREARRS